jgi:YD repeat-containing protein
VNGSGGATTGNLVQKVYDPTGADQVTSYGYDANNRLDSVTESSGTTITYTYDADGERTSKTVVSGSTTTVVNDAYANGKLISESDGSGTLLASFTYDSMGVPVSVQVGSDPTTAPRYYYQYDGQGNVIALTDEFGGSAGIYAYDAFGNVLTDTPRPGCTG